MSAPPRPNLRLTLPPVLTIQEVAALFHAWAAEHAAVVAAIRARLHSCRTCGGRPPAGFTCNTCGAS